MEIRTVTEIAAPAAVVWEILTDLAQYPVWNPFTYRVEGELKMGAVLKLNVRFPDQSEVISRHIVCAIEPLRELSWRETNIPLLLWTKRRQLIEPLDAHRLRLVNQELAWGPLAPLVIGLYGKRIAGGMRAAAEALKMRAEQD